MTIKLNCPVCGYQGIDSNTCPNCDTDVAVIRMLLELPPVENRAAIFNLSRWQLTAALLLVLCGFGLASWGGLIFPQPLTVMSNSSVVVDSNDTPEPPPTPLEPAQPTTYTVKSGDNLSSITEALCGKGVHFAVMVTANPQLKGREDHIDVGEVFKLPNCQEGN